MTARRMWVLDGARLTTRHDELLDEPPEPVTPTASRRWGPLHRVEALAAGRGAEVWAMHDL